MASLSHFTKLWGVGAIPGCLVHGLGVFRQKNSDPECKSWIQEGLGCEIWVDWFAYERDACKASPSPSLEIGWSWQEAVPLGLARPQMPKHRKHLVNMLLNTFFLLVVHLADGTCVPDTLPATQPCRAPALHFSHQSAAERAGPCFFSAQWNASAPFELSSPLSPYPAAALPASPPWHVSVTSRKNPRPTHPSPKSTSFPTLLKVGCPHNLV